MTDDKSKDESVSGPGMPEMNPPEGGPNANPDEPNPSQFFPPRPGTTPGEFVEHSDESGEESGQ